MKINILLSQSSASEFLSKKGSQLAKVLNDRFASDLKLSTKNEFSTAVKTQFVTKALIDGPRQGTKSTVSLLGSFYMGKSMVGGITYPINAVAYDRDSDKCYLFLDRKYVGDISKQQLRQTMSILQESVQVMQPASLEMLLNRLA